jgi:nucleotide-binding universal stress UspA family protein
MDCALRLAHRYHSTLFTLNVLPHTPFVEAPDPDPERIRRVAQQRLAGLAASDSLKGIQHKEMIEQGEVADVLCRFVRENDIDLIVLSTEGRTGVRKFLLGSVAEEIFRSAECPVMTLSPHAVRDVVGGPLQHVLYATDFGPESVHAFPYALHLAEQDGARLTLLHVAREPGPLLEEPEPGAMPQLNPYKVVQENEQQLRNLIPKQNQLSHEPECLVQFGPAVETILRMASQDADLIVLGAKRSAALTKHLGAGVAYQVVCGAPCPVISVRARGRW